MAKKRGAKQPKQMLLDTSDVKRALAAHIRTVERIVKRHERKLEKAGGRGKPAGKEIAPKLTRAKQALNSLRAAKSAMDSTCGCEPAQACPFDL
jgi:ERCC4-type nuclease